MNVNSVFLLDSSWLKEPEQLSLNYWAYPNLVANVFKSIFDSAISFNFVIFSIHKNVLIDFELLRSFRLNSNFETVVVLVEWNFDLFDEFKCTLRVECIWNGRQMSAYIK